MHDWPESLLPLLTYKPAGYGKFAGVGDVGVLIFLRTMFTKLPAYRNAPLAKHWPSSRNLKKVGINVKMESGSPPPGEPEQPQFPLLMFSHGLGGTRTMYSSVCGEFASYGFVVCAVEHRDGSGPRTYVNHSPSGEGSMEAREKTAGGNLDHNARERERGYDVTVSWTHFNHKCT